MKFKLLPGLFFLIPSLVVSQTSLSSSGGDLYDIISDIEQYIDSNSTGPSIKQFNRWRNHWEPRLYPHGDFKVASNAETQWALSFGGQQAMSSDFNPDWTELGPFSITSSTGIGRVVDLEMATSNPDILFAGTWGGGVWKTLDGGSNWFQLGTDKSLPILKIASVEVNQANLNQIWAATGCKYNYDFGSVGVYRTLDGGVTWQAVNNGLPQFSQQNGQAANCSKLLIHPTNPNLIRLVTTTGLYQTTNATGACTWSLIFNPAQESLFNIEYHPTNSNIMYLSGKNVYQSTNGGTTWAPLVNGQGNGVNQFLQGFDQIRRIQIAVSSATPGLLYAMLLLESNGSDGNPSQKQTHFLRYQNNTWTELGTLNQVGASVGLARDHTRSAMAVNPFDGQNVLYGQAHFFEFISSYWKPRGYTGTGHADNHDFIFHPSIPNVVIVANDGGVYRITKNGDLWTIESRYNGLAVSNQYHSSSDKEKAYDIIAGNQDNGTHMFTPFDNTWSFRGGGDGMRSTTKTHGSLTNLITCSNRTGFGHAQSTAAPPANFPINAGSGLLSQLNNLISPDTDLFDWVPPIIQDPNNADITYIGGGHLYKLNMQQAGNPAISLALRRHELVQWQNLLAVGVAPGNSNYIYVAYGPSETEPPVIGRTTVGGGDIWNGGGHYWDDITPQGITMNYPRAVAVSSKNPDKAWICFSGYTATNKVLMTTDGGQAWTDYSDGLPLLPLNCIVNNNSLDGSLYVATDVGVYYRDASMAQWEPYFDGLPNVQVNWLEINYSNNKLRAATYGRGLWEANLVCGYNGNPGDETVFSQNTTLTSDKFFYNDIVVDNNATLTLSSTCTLHMTDDSKIHIKPGAKLVVDGGKITSMCTERWRGIYVSGNITASQTESPALFGKLTLKNGAIIEHVQDGICNFGLTSGGATDWNTFGGIIQARQSTFVNNRYGPFFGPYSNFVTSNSTQILTNDLSYIDRCEFRTDSDFGSDTPIDQVTLWGTRGVNVTGSKFHNTATATGNPVGRGRGIYSLDAIYTVKDYCSIIPTVGQTCPPQNQTKSTFQGLQHGIEAVGTAASTSKATVNQSEFIDNHKGIVLTSSNGSSIKGNIFRPGLFGSYPVGLYINQTSSYTVSCNTFTSVGGSVPLTGGDQRYGISSLNCGVASPIQKNTFTSLYVGAEALGSNRNSAGAGLKYLSNTFDGNYVGIVALTNGSLPNQGISTSQGSSSAPAGNFFSAHSSLVDILNYTQPFTYFRHAGTGDWTPTIFGSITVTATTQPWSLWSCETAPQQSMALYNGATEQQQTKEVELAAKIDGGNTQQLQSQVVATDNADDMEVYGTLMQGSPNLSEQVLLSAVERPAPMPNAMLRDVLTANPQAGKSEEVMTGLSERTQQLPEYMVWQVEESSQGISPIEKLRADISTLATERQQMADALTDQWLLTDGEPVQMDSAIALLAAKDDEAALYRLALMAAEEGDAVNAAAHANRRSEKLGEQNSDRFSELAAFLAQMSADGRNIGQLTEGELALVTDLAASEDVSGNHAKAILQHLGQTTIELPVLPVPPLPQLRRYMPSFEGASTLNVFPNPGRDHITVDYSFAEPEGNNLFEVIDAQGRTLLQKPLKHQRDQMIIDIRALSAGSYIYRLSQNGNTMQSGSFNVVGE